VASQPNRTTAFDSSVAEPLLIIGASSRAAAQSARRAGFFVAAADLFADVDLAEICPATRMADYPREFGDVLRQQPACGWLYTGGLENYPDLIDQWAKLCPLLGNGGEVLRRVRDPAQIAACLQNARLPCPAVETDGQRFPHVPTDGSWLRKPRKSAAGDGISLWTGGPNNAATHYLQKRIFGESISAVFVASDGRAQLLGITRQLLEATNNQLATRYAGTIGPIELPLAFRRQFVEIGNALTQHFGLTGIFGVDAIVNDAGVWPLEVNPRYPASAEVLERATGVSMIGCHASACLPLPLGEGRGEGHRRTENGLPNAAHPSLARRANGLGEPEALAPGVYGQTLIHGKQIVYAKTAVTITRDLREVEPSLADIPAVGTHIPAGAPIATVLAVGTSVNEVENLLAEQANQLLNKLRGPT
jgi:predicted ATP-grasp superfamily ATP-dependent carboligase